MWQNATFIYIVERDHPTDHDKQLSKVLSLYMRQSVRPSWEEVTTALWDIGEKRTAQQITDEYGMAFSMCSRMCQMSYMNMISACHHATLESNVLLFLPIYRGFQVGCPIPSSTYHNAHIDWPMDEPCT